MVPFLILPTTGAPFSCTGLVSGGEFAATLLTGTLGEVAASAPRANSSTGLCCRAGLTAGGRTHSLGEIAESTRSKDIVRRGDFTAIRGWGDIAESIRSNDVVRRGDLTAIRGWGEIAESIRSKDVVRRGDLTAIRGWGGIAESIRSTDPVRNTLRDGDITGEVADLTSGDSARGEVTPTLGDSPTLRDGDITGEVAAMLGSTDIALGDVTATL